MQQVMSNTGRGTWHMARRSPGERRMLSGAGVENTSDGADM